MTILEMTEKQPTNDVFINTELSEKSFLELVPDFILEIEEDLTSLLDYFHDKNLMEVRLTAHKIKGTASSYGAMLLSDSALEVQVAPDDLAEMSVLIKKMTAATETTITFAKENFLQK